MNVDELRTFLIVDDHEVVRKGLKLLLSDMYPSCTIYEAGDGREAETILKKHTVALMILDIQIPDTNSFELMQFVTNFFPATRVLIFSMGAESLYGRRFIAAGASGYLSKESSMADIYQAVDAVLSGRKYLSGKLLDLMVQEISGPVPQNPFAALSSREFEIASLLLRGRAVGEIAKQVHLQPSTVGTYKSRIFDKLRVKNVLELREMARVYDFN